MSGYIKDHRKELDSDIWLMPPLYHRTWQWLKYNVNHSDREIPLRDGTKMQIKRGQRLTSVRDIAKGISWYEGAKYKEPNPKTISAVLDWMVKTNMILINRGQGNREYTLITLINYEIYNEKESQGNSKVTPDGEVREQQADINKNEKNGNKVKKEIIKILYGDHVLLSDEQFQKLTNDLTEPILTKLIDDINYWFTQKPTRIKDYKDHNLMIRKWHKNNLDKPLTVLNGGKTNYKPNKTGLSGKPILPIIQNSPSTSSLSAEQRAEIRQKARRLDGNPPDASNH